MGCETEVTGLHKLHLFCLISLVPASTVTVLASFVVLLVQDADGLCMHGEILFIRILLLGCLLATAAKGSICNSSCFLSI